MRQFSFYVDEKHHLSECLAQFKESCPKEYSAILLTVFTKFQKTGPIWDMMEVIHREIPDAIIAGSTASGEICSGKLSLETTVLNFMVFEKTNISVFAYDFQKVHPDDVSTVLLGQCRLLPDLAALGLFVTLKSGSPTALFNRLSQLPKEVAVFGCGACGYETEDVTYVFTRGAIFKKGLLAICFDGKDLHVKITSHLGWKPLGRPMEISDMFGDNIVTKLDQSPAISVYEKYLDIRKSDNFIRDTTEFPLLLDRGGKTIARLPIAATNDGALLFAADLRKGERLWLSYGDPTELLRLSEETRREICKFAPEGIIVFDCIARRIFLQNNVEPDLGFLQDTGIPSGGFYTYGEIVRMGRDIEVLNVTMVCACFREGDATQSLSLPEGSKNALEGSISYVQRMARFIEATTKELEEANAKLEQIAAQDRLTGLFNRGEIENVLRNEISGPLAKVRPISVIMLDMDHFKDINDTYGHQAGDRVLKFAADTLRASVRQGDCAGRWGGEEFLVLLPGTDLDGAAGVAERIRTQLESTPILPDGKSATASFGVAEYKVGEQYEDFYRRLDKFLYEAKEKGRNTVMFHSS